MVLGQLGRITLNVAKVPAQMERQRRRERMEEALKESGLRGEGLMAKILAQVPIFQTSVGPIKDKQIDRSLPRLNQRTFSLCTVSQFQVK